MLSVLFALVAGGGDCLLWWLLSAVLLGLFLL